MPYLLDFVYLLLILLASPWLIYRAVRQGKYRQGFAEKLLGLAPRRAGDRPGVWFHAVSVGEVNLLASLLDEIRRQRPWWECVVSTTTITGYAVARKKYPTLTVFYCPLDFSWSVRAAMKRVRPSLLVLAELELWPNLVRAARSQGARVAIVNGRLSDRSLRGYRRLRPFVGPVLRQIDLVAAQNDEYSRRFIELGAAPAAVCVTGSIKYDGAQTDRGNSATSRLRVLAGIGDDDVVFLAGSTQEGEEAASLATYQSLSREFPKLRLIVVPRHPERFAAVAQLLDSSRVAWQRRSRLDLEGPRPEAGVLLVDTVGELGAWWGVAAIAFVGGSLGSRGGQNMIEPAAYGAAVSFGPNTRNFRDIVAALLAHQAAVIVRDERELAAFVRRCLADVEYRQSLGCAARQLVASQSGATARTLALLVPLVDSSRGQKAAA
ncbi:MAG TPA: 3-deoxy-D-manno-octulosonic acid transferase [Pirellulales bacterium]|jgi:3-deoxy-D-manno-octulosonic-acid transferase|nr:3-deoxy-D-manno-octulosonic acid transferase [Pirellulales bacterium]